MADSPISLPAGYASAFAVGYADATTGNLEVVGATMPLPVRVVPQSAPPAQSGTFDASGRSAGYAPLLAQPVFLTVSGTWTGTIRVLRSTDDDSTHHMLTAAGQEWAVFTANVCEPVWEEHVAGAQLYVEVELLSGVLEYTFAQ